MEIPRRSAACRKFSWKSTKAGVLHGATAPSLSDRRLFGTTLSRSMSTMRPKPSQRGQAPRGLLKLNRWGVGRV